MAVAWDFVNFFLRSLYLCWSIHTFIWVALAVFWGYLTSLPSYLYSFLSGSYVIIYCGRNVDMDNVDADEYKARLLGTENGIFEGKQPF